MDDTLVKRPWSLKCIEIVRKGNNYEEVDRYSCSEFKTSTDAKDAAERWAWEHGLEIGNFHYRQGFDLTFYVRQSPDNGIHEEVD